MAIIIQIGTEPNSSLHTLVQMKKIHPAIMEEYPRMAIQIGNSMGRQTWPFPIFPDSTYVERELVI